MTRAGYPPDQIAEAAAALPDEVDRHDDRDVLANFSLSAGADAADGVQPMNQASARPTYQVIGGPVCTRLTDGRRPRTLRQPGSSRSGTATSPVRRAA